MFLCAELFEACVAGDLKVVKVILPHVREALNEFMGNDRDNLLMW